MYRCADLLKLKKVWLMYCAYEKNAYLCTRKNG